MRFFLVSILSLVLVFSISCASTPTPRPEPTVVNTTTIVKGEGGRGETIYCNEFSDTFWEEVKDSDGYCFTFYREKFASEKEAKAKESEWDVWNNDGGMWRRITMNDPNPRGRRNEGWFEQGSSAAEELNAVSFLQNPRVADFVIETRVIVDPDIPAVFTETPEDDRLKHEIRNIIGAGLIFGRTTKGGEDEFFMFRLAGEEGAVLGRIVDGGWQDIANPRARNFLDGRRLKFDGKQDYKLRVEHTGGRVVCYVDDEPVIDQRGLSVPIGQVGLVTFKTGAMFDYFKIKEL